MCHSFMLRDIEMSLELKVVQHIDIFYGNRHDVEAFTSGVIGRERCLLEKRRFSVFFGILEHLEDKPNKFWISPPQRHIFRRFLTTLVHGILLRYSVWPQFDFLNSRFQDFHYQKTRFLLFTAKVKDLRNWNSHNSIPRQILGQETCYINYIWYKLIFKWEYFILW